MNLILALLSLLTFITPILSSPVTAAVSPTSPSPPPPSPSPVLHADPGSLGSIAAKKTSELTVDKDTTPTRVQAQQIAHQTDMIWLDYTKSYDPLAEVTPPPGSEPARAELDGGIPFSQTTYYTCKTRGTYTHCGWHIPIVWVGDGSRWEGSVWRVGAAAVGVGLWLLG